MKVDNAALEQTRPVDPDLPPELAELSRQAFVTRDRGDFRALLSHPAFTTYARRLFPTPEDACAFLEAKAMDARQRLLDTAPAEVVAMMRDDEAAFDPSTPGAWCRKLRLVMKYISPGGCRSGNGAASRPRCWRRTMNKELAHQIDALPNLVGTEHEPDPHAQLDWALRWAKRGLHIFPCEPFLGRPLVTGWYRAAAATVANIVEWWAESPDADIAAVPDLSGHFVILVNAEEGGLESLAALEDRYGQLQPDFTTTNRWRNLHMWFTGSAMTSHHVHGHGIHVLGAGHYVYMPNSEAPDQVWK